MDAWHLQISANRGQHRLSFLVFHHMKLHSRKTEIFSNRIRTKTRCRHIREAQGWISAPRSSCPNVLRDSEPEQQPVPPSSRKAGSLLSCRRKPLFWLAERFRFRHKPRDVDHAPANCIPGGAETVTAPRGLTLKGWLFYNRQAGCFSFLVPLTIYIFSIKLIFISFYLNTKSMNISRTVLTDPQYS
jgi:hypothetical protein